VKVLLIIAINRFRTVHTDKHTRTQTSTHAHALKLYYMNPTTVTKGRRFGAEEGTAKCKSEACEELSHLKAFLKLPYYLQSLCPSQEK